VNIQQLRNSLKDQWLTYYRDNREWLTRVGVWVTCEGERRPSSSFILATLSVLEPQLTQLLPLIVDLSSNPDRIVIALGLNFNPDDELKVWTAAVKSANGQVRLLPSGLQPDPSTDRSATLSNSKPQLQPQLQPQPIAPSPRNARADVDVKASVPSTETQPLTSPFEEPIDWVDPSFEPSADASPDLSATQPVGEPTFTTISPTGETIVRTAMDTVELASGELPDRNQLNSVDETCEGRKKSAVRMRHD
jgi:hypothetical protein